MTMRGMLAAVIAAWAGMSAGMSAAQSPFPNEVDVQMQMEARISDSGVDLATDVDPVFAEVTVGPNFASADAPPGKLRGLATLTDRPRSELISSSGLVASVFNGSGAVASFAAGAITLDAEAAFARVMGSGVLGLAANGLVLSMGFVIVDANDVERYGEAAVFALRVSEIQGQPADLRIDQVIPDGFELLGVDSVSASSLDLVLRSPALELLPGETMAIVVAVAGSAMASTLFDGSGYSATTDYGDTLSLSMVLPAGFGVNADIPLDWITTTPIPEPATALLFAAGALGLGLGRGLGRGFSRRGARPRGRSPRSWSAATTPPPAA